MADQSITDYTAATALDRADLVEVVQDVATTPVNRSATLDVLDPGNTLGGTVTGTNGIAVGATAEALDQPDAIAIGQDAEASRDNTIAIGHNALADTTGGGHIAIGNGAQASASDAVVIGNGASAPGGTGSMVVIGAGATSSGDGSVVIGHDATGRPRSVVIGDGADGGASNSDSVAIGAGATTTHSDSVALGHDTATTATFQVMVGPRDIEITGTDKGLVLEDRTLGTRHRVYLDNGTLEIEAA